MDKIIDLIWADIEPTLHTFFGELNWDYIIMLVIILYGVKYKVDFEWFRNLMNRFNATNSSSWIAGFFTGFVFALFKCFETNLTWEYFASLIRSWFLVVIFSSILIDSMSKIIKVFLKRVHDKVEKS